MSPRRPDLGKRITDLETQVKNLQRQLEESPKGLGDLDDVLVYNVTDGQAAVYDTADGLWKPGTAGGGTSGPVFTFGKPLLISDAGRWYPSEDTTFTGVFTSLDGAGTSTTTVLVQKNGSTVSTINLGSGVNTVDTAVSISLTAKTDYLTAAISANGTGAFDLTVQFY